MTFNEMANKVCGEIPSGWEIRIELGLWGGRIELIDPVGDAHPMNIDGDAGGTVLEAVERAKELDEVWPEEKAPAPSDNPPDDEPREFCSQCGAEFVGYHACGAIIEVGEE